MKQEKDDDEEHQDHEQEQEQEQEQDEKEDQSCCLPYRHYLPRPCPSLSFLSVCSFVVTFTEFSRFCVYFFLNRFLQVTGRPVVVKLNTGVDYKGVLACLDGYMNIALEQVHTTFSTKFMTDTM